jgi:hypothetical protein
MGLGDTGFGFLVEPAQEDRDHSVEESILGAVNARVVDGIAGEDDPEIGVNGYMLAA